MVNRYRIAILISTSIFALECRSSERFAGVDLWLPASYQTHYQSLVDAAEKVEKDPYCHKLLSGRMIESSSTKEQLYFQFRCRTEDRKTFSIQVNSKTLEMTNTYEEHQRKLAAEEEQRRLEAEAEAARLIAEEEAMRLSELRKIQSRYWSVCRKGMRKRLRKFDSLEILTEGIPEPVIAGEKFTYSVLFDAKNPERKTLNYVVNCEISGLQDYQISVSVRKDD